MRHLPKSPDVPASLQRLAPPADADGVNDALYSRKDVKEALMADHHGKCVYCECRLNGDYGHIEHYRPKLGYVPFRGASLRTPGYFRQAYEWSNLLLSCSVCNTSYKRNHFALADERFRAAGEDDVSGESPLLINPSAEDPARHIRFHRHLAAPAAKRGKESERGKYTIEVLGLNRRGELVELRRRRLAEHDRLKRIERLASALPQDSLSDSLLREAREALDEFSRPDAEFSAMFLPEK